jgi:KipI family sensor histidine kinase inhibitor
MARPFSVKLAGDTALIIGFGDAVLRETSELVVHVATWLQGEAVAGVLEVVPTFRSLMIVYEPLVVSPEELAIHVYRACLIVPQRAVAARLWRIPVCYDEEFAIDLPALSLSTGLTKAQLIDAHSSGEQYVYMIGFLPGQPYIGDLPLCFDLPRLKTPRAKVAAGAVGVVRRLSCIYPLETPCGWHIIGAMPQKLPRGDQAIKAGDRIDFEPISRREYEASLKSQKSITCDELEAA